MGGGLEATSEEVLGELFASARLAHGYERLRIVFTSRRIVVAHLGKRGIGAAATSLLGSVGPGVEDLILSGKEHARKGAKTPQQILEMDRENFEIPYVEIVSLDYHYGGRLIVITPNDKFDLVSQTTVDQGLLDQLHVLLGSRMNNR